ncbi:MAG TPA: DapH/DapD/GlmU-related protein [Acidimicrobiales bacterium]|nr:DapH/DapD/GlmU-related protein [Acidimicrobiales bacterium]
MRITDIPVRVVRRLGELRRRGPRGIARACLTNYLIPSDFFPRDLIVPSLRAVGLEVAASCGLKGARIQTTQLSIGAGTWANRGLYIEGDGPVSIGKGVLLGPEVLIVTSTHERDDEQRVRPDATHRAVRIGNGCWIGARVVILPGVTIHDDVTVAAGAVVASDVGPGGLYGGVPARKIR